MNTREVPFQPEQEKRIELSHDQVANLLLIADSLSHGTNLTTARMNALSAAEKVSIPESLGTAMDELGNDKDSTLRMIDTLRRLLAGLEIDHE